MRGPQQEVVIESLAAGGDGVGRAEDGRIVFVPFTAPGDRVRVRVVAERARHLRAEVVELLEPGPGRADPLCAVFGSCGGCAWQHLDYATQLRAKQRILCDALARIAHVNAPEPVPMHACPVPYGYRARARAVAQRGRVGFRRRRSHAVCATSRCPILVPDLDAALATLSARPPRRDGEWELVAGSEGDARLRELPALGDGEPIVLRVGPDRLRVSPGVFFQANAPLRERLAEAVDAAAGEGRLVLELFAGAGFFTLGLARRFERVVAVEADERAAADLAANLAQTQADRVSIRAETVASALDDAALTASSPDAVVLDPPRTGLGEEGAGAVARLGARRLVYVSCDPATLARDVGVFVDRGYALESLAGFDFFPQTPHLEALAVLAT